MTITEMARKGGRSKSERKRAAAVANLERARQAYRAQLAAQPPPAAAPEPPSSSTSTQEPPCQAS